MKLINYKLYEDMEKKISETEEKIEWKLPEDYINFIKKYNYAVFDNVYFIDFKLKVESLLNINSGIVNSTYKSGFEVNEVLNNEDYRMIPIIIVESKESDYESRICYDKKDSKLYLVSYNFESLNDAHVEYIADTFTEFLTILYEKPFELKFPLETGELENLEKQLRIEFPVVFKDLLHLYNGEGIEGKELYKTKTGEERAFSRFLKFNKNPKYEGFLEEFNDLVKFYKPSFPKKGVYPFSRTGGGDYLCLDYRQNKENPKVVYFTHDTFYGEEYETIAESFDEWFESLYPDPDKLIAYI